MDKLVNKLIEQRKREIRREEMIKKWNRKELREIEDQSFKVPKTEVLRVIQMLKEKSRLAKHKPKTTIEKSFANRRKRCRGSYNPMETASWNSPAYITKSIRSCILKRDFNTLTQLIYEMCKERQAYYFSYIKQVTLFNIMANSQENQVELLTQFNQMFGSS